MTQGINRVSERIPSEVPGSTQSSRSLLTAMKRSVDKGCILCDTLQRPQGELFFSILGKVTQVEGRYEGRGR